jgi:hypothetical protein
MRAAVPTTPVGTLLPMMAKNVDAIEVAQPAAYW